MGTATGFSFFFYFSFFFRRGVSGRNRFYTREKQHTAATTFEVRRNVFCGSISLSLLEILVEVTSRSSSCGGDSGNSSSNSSTSNQNECIAIIVVFFFVPF